MRRERDARKARPSLIEEQAAFAGRRGGIIPAERNFRHPNARIEVVQGDAAEKSVHDTTAKRGNGETYMAYPHSAPGSVSFPEQLPQTMSPTVPWTGEIVTAVATRLAQESIARALALQSTICIGNKNE